MIGQWLRRRFPWPPVGQTDFGSLRRLTAIGDCLPGAAGALDRHLLDAFLLDHASDIRGRVLEEGPGGFAATYGGDRLSSRARFDADQDWTGVAQKAAGFDCILLPGTLQRVMALRPALHDLHARLRPGGVLLATLPGAAHRTDERACWRFTPYSARLLFAEVFGDDAVTLSTRGNVLIALAHAHRLPASEVGAPALRVDDPAFPFMIGVRAVRRAEA
jgi:hypothetical protein